MKRQRSSLVVGCSTTTSPRSELATIGSNQAALLARRSRGGSSVWLDGLSGLSGSSDEVFGPTNQTNPIDEIDQMNQISFDARSEGQSGDSPEVDIDDF